MSAKESFYVRPDGRHNIPRSVKDPHYRYHMAPLAVHTESRGNGVKTCISNLGDIASSLDRDVQYLAKFIAGDLGVGCVHSKEVGKWLFTGNHSTSALALKIDSFIASFVECRKCTNPETVMSVEQKTNIILDCKACGKISNVNPKLRLCSFILKRPPAPKEQKGADATVSQQFGALTIEDLEFASEWTESETNGFETSEAPLDPVDALSRFLLAKKKPTTDEIQDRVKAMALQYGWKKQAIVAAVFGALFGKDMVNRVADHAETLSLFVQGDSDQLRVLSLFEKLCSIDATAASKVSFILQELYDHDVLDEDNIVKWSTTLPKAGDLQSAKALRERASKFVAWLCADDSADSAEEEQK